MLRFERAYRAELLGRGELVARADHLPTENGAIAWIERPDNLLGVSRERLAHGPAELFRDLGLGIGKEGGEQVDPTWPAIGDGSAKGQPAIVTVE